MIKTEAKTKQNITKQLKLDLKFFKSEVQTMEQLKTSLSGWYYREKLTDTIIKNVNSDKYDLKQAKEVISKRLIKFYDNKINKVLADIESIKKVDKSACRWGQCMIDWNRNATWGNCPKGSYRNGHAFADYKSVTGCGYDKLSTLTANMFNDDKYLMSFILDYCEKHNITNDNIRERLGYGIRLSSISGLPYFEGAVGVECHKSILKKLGFKVIHNETKKSDFIEFERITK